MHISITESLDISGAVFSLIATIYYVKADIRAWPMSLIATTLNVSLYGLTGIYGDMNLEMIYFFSAIYGWWVWRHGTTNRDELPITSLSARQYISFTLIAIIGIYSVAQILIHFTNSQVPWWDASTTVLSLIAQWLICRKIIQTWFLWFIVDAMYVGLYFDKAIYAHSILLIIYLGLAIAGYLNWLRLKHPQVGELQPVKS